MSSVFYRFGAAKDESKITFDGTHISVFDVKRQILVANKMGNGKDFDLGVFDNVTGEGRLIPSSMCYCVLTRGCRAQG
jgi:protein MPE1